MKTIAFYLPQFHPIPENDRWWGKGFTEWTNVTRAEPLFEGHNQPRLPADLGFYDLRLPQVRSEQARLARHYGLHGFCYYYYWFNGKKLLDLPLREMLESGEPDFPFCLCYANENWTRRWDGQENEILIRQEHSPENDRRFIRDVLQVMKDHRYIRINDRPLLLVYRAQLFPDIRATTAAWRDEAARAGFDGLFLCKCQTFGDLVPPAEEGFDAAVEFPPHFMPTRRLSAYEDRIRRKHPSFSGWVMDYRDAAMHMMTRKWPDYPLFKTVMLAWDNSPRSLRRATVFHHFSCDYYERWLAKAAKDTLLRHPPERRLVFVNAWNEWAEGTYLEPDQQHGHSYLRATRRAIGAVESLEPVFDRFRSLQPREGSALAATASNFFQYIEQLDQVEALLVKNIEDKDDKLSELDEQVRNMMEEIAAKKVEEERMSAEMRELRNQLSRLDERARQLRTDVEARDKIISAVYETRGWWLLSKLSRFRKRIG